MRSYQMDRRIVIETPTETQDSTGAAVATWTTLATVWAEVRPMTGKETFTADQVLGDATSIFIIRYRSDITDKMRISYGGNYYDIRYAREIGRREGLEITAQIVRL
jgi:SPP1 family predicted phage head-tail adaptor